MTRVPTLPTPARTAPRGFTLVEILAVVAILALLFSLAMPIITKARAAGDLTACKSNLRNVALALGQYVDTRRGGKWPQERGVRLLLLLYKDGEIQGENLNTFLCPGTNDQSWPDEAHRGEWGSGYEDWENIDTACISYAGRDAKNHPIVKSKLDQEVLASDDNEFVPNHSFITNIVYADGRVSQRDAKDYPELEAAGLDYLEVGPDSLDEDLQKLLVD